MPVHVILNPELYADPHHGVRQELVQGQVPAPLTNLSPQSPPPMGPGLDIPPKHHGCQSARVQALPGTCPHISSPLTVPAAWADGIESPQPRPNSTESLP